jgi:hypothetical protein
MKELILEALHNEGYEIFDGRFVEELGVCGLLTVAWDNDADDVNKIQIAQGDFEQYYYSNYDNCIVIGENSDLDDIFDNEFY